MEREALNGVYDIDTVKVVTPAVLVGLLSLSLSLCVCVCVCVCVVCVCVCVREREREREKERLSHTGSVTVNSDVQAHRCGGWYKCICGRTDTCVLFQPVSYRCTPPPVYIQLSPSTCSDMVCRSVVTVHKAP